MHQQFKYFMLLILKNTKLTCQRLEVEKWHLFSATAIKGEFDLKW